MTSLSLLPAVEIETAPAPTASVIFLHGLGDDGHGWSGAVDALALPASLPVRFVFPHAPVMPVTINNGYPMRAWYDIRAADLTHRADLDGVRQSQRAIEALIARERERGVASGRIVLGGFSQGGAIALYAGLRHAERLAGIVAMSTYLIGADSLETEAADANRATPIFMAHGTADPVVRFDWGASSHRTLERGGWPVEWHSYPMEHSATIEEILALGQFLARVLGASSAGKRDSAS